MSKSISVTNPNNVVSLVLEPSGNGAKIGGKLDLSIFTSATTIDVSDLDISELGDLPLNLVNFDGSGNKITNIPGTFTVPSSLINFDLNQNSLNTTDIERILTAFIAKGDVTAINPDPIIDISQFGNAVPNATGLGYITTLGTNGWNVKYNPGEYVLSTDAINVSEGGLDLTININRTTSNIADGTQVDYVISGVVPADFTSSGFDGVTAPSNLEGSFIINSNTDTATFSLATDTGVSNYLEGETLVMTLKSPNEVTSISIPIVDTTIAPYTLTAVNTQLEGQSFNVAISTTTGTTVADGTTVPYTITGIQANDIAQSLTGNFTLTNNTGTIPITVLIDQDYNEVETMVITLDAPFTAVSKEIRIFDQ